MKLQISVLLVCFPQGLVVFLGLLFEELDSSLEGLVLGVVLEALASSVLSLLQGGLNLFNLLLKNLVAVVERCDFLFLGQVLLFQCLDTGLELVDLLMSFVGLGTEGVHALVTIWSVEFMKMMECRGLCMCAS